jgi:ABC-type multidrug transport system permease subunit
LEYDIEDEIVEESMIHNKEYSKADNQTIDSFNQTTGNSSEEHIKEEVEGVEGVEGVEEVEEVDNEEVHEDSKESPKDMKHFDNDDEEDKEVNDYEEHEASKPKLLTTIDLYMDNTNLLISGAIKATVIMALRAARNRSIELSVGSSHAPPIQIMDPMIYGLNESEMSEFITPGVVIAITFLSSILFPGLTIIREREKRHLERSTIAGVKALELIISHLIIHIVILIIQIILVLICIFVVFELPLIGSIYLVFAIIFIQGLCGLIYSITISSFCCDQNQAIIVWLTTFSIIIIFSGTFWPIECMPKLAIIISNIFPQSIAGKGLRSVISRGWDLSYSTIQLGLIVPIIWITVLFFISVLMFRIRK